jgi:glycosyltransferase involved in cell wall biosynthesis
MNVAFLNENTLGHTSYLPRFAATLAARPELGVTPYVLDALPLPAHLRRLGDTAIRGLWQVGLDFHATRWRIAISRHAREQLDALRAQIQLDAVVVNTQSTGLELGDLPRELPILVALDATFRQLADSPWLGPNRLSRWLQPVTLSRLLRRERDLFAVASRLLPWSERVAESLRRDYGIGGERIEILPPSLAAPAVRVVRTQPRLPQLLFLGGDFVRKGGPLLLEVFRRELVGRAELQLVTQSDVPAEPGVVVHRGVQAGSPEWLARWHEADLFVFPSKLETFGIVLLEALAFKVPVVASAAGAASSILGQGAFGRVVDPLTADTLAAALKEALAAPEARVSRAAAGRASFEERFELGRNAGRLAELLHTLGRRS